MQRYLAIEQESKPFITWIGTSLPLGALVVNEEEVPANVYGVCPLKIVAGELVARTAPEMTAFQEEYAIQMALQNQANIDIDNESFSYSGMDFPMNQTARLRYAALLEQATASYNVLDMIGRSIPLTDTDTPLLVAAMNAKIITLTNP